MQQRKWIQINIVDNVALALTPLAKGEMIEHKGSSFPLLCDIPTGHKFALEALSSGKEIFKYGFPIGHLTTDVKRGDWLHTHNLKTSLGDEETYHYTPQFHPLPSPPKKNTFKGYVREDGEVGVRNEIWIVPTVGCVNGIATRIANEFHFKNKNKNIDGFYAWTHPFGCSQLGDDHLTTQKILAGLCKNPNAAGILVIGLGCENNTLESFQKTLGAVDPNRYKFLVTQKSSDELADASHLIEELITYAEKQERTEVNVSKLKIGLKCGGSDGLSGITANSLIGAFSDLLVAAGGSTLLTEVPEMFGAEQILMNRAKEKSTFLECVNLITNFKNYYKSHNQVIYENPSPGNKEGGISTLEEKSLGCVQKGGKAPVVSVLNFGEPLKIHGLGLLNGPGNDIVAATLLAASGVQMICFSTGRGTPLGGPVPTIKISSNTNLFQAKRNWIDFDAGKILLEGEQIERLAEEFYLFMIDVAEGKFITKNETNGYREISIFKDGVML